MKKTVLSPRDRVPVVPSPWKVRSRRAGIGAGLLLLLVLAALGWIARVRLFPSGAVPPDGSAESTPVDPTEARLREAAVRQPRDATVHAALGSYLLSQARPVSALWELKAARSLQTRDDPTLGREQAHALELIGRRKLSMDELRAALVAHPGDGAARVQLATALLAVARPRDALSVLCPPGRRAPDGAAAMLLLGRAYHALGNRAEAQSALQRYADLAPPLEPHYEPLGRFLLATGRPEEARRALMRDQHVAFRTGELHYLLGLTFLRSQPIPDLGKAGAAFTVALHFDPRHAQARSALAQVLERQGSLTQAAAQYEAAIQIDPTLPEPHLRLASLLMGQGQTVPALQQRGIAATLEDRLPDAEAAFREMLDSAPGNLDAAQSLILTCVGMKRLDQAGPGVDALHRLPFDPDAAERISKLYLITGSRKLCRELAGAWHQRQPKSAAALRLLGQLAVDELQVSQGIRWCEEAWSVEPGRADTAAALGVAWARVPTRANLERARGWLQRAVALAAGDAGYLNSLGQVLEQLGRTHEAQETYLRALDLDPSRSSAMNSLARLAQGMHQTAQARLFGRIAREMEDDQRTADQARQRLWDHPRDSEAHLAVAQQLANAGELGKANRHLQQALKERPEWTAARSLQRSVEALLDWP